jgi:dimethylhistidine N-methyltransferase
MSSFVDDFTRGLRGRPKRIPAKYFYDARGAQLFDQICRLSAYYPTRAELDILRRHGPDIAGAVGPDVDVIEPGSGSGLKTRLLLSALDRVGLYVPVDVSREQLHATAEALRREYPALAVQPVCADFTAEFAVPERRPGARTVVFFPGSTIGNFEPIEAAVLLARLARLTGPNGGVLIGVDLKKDPALLHRAYNDESGVTAAFNLNVLVRANLELGADFALGRFRHYAFYNPREGRIEMTLVSLERQEVKIGGERFAFEAGEPLTTEYSYKYELGQFAELAAAGGLSAREAWLDPRRLFAIFWLVPR